MNIEEAIELMEAWCVIDIAVPAQEAWEFIKDRLRGVERICAGCGSKLGSNDGCTNSGCDGTACYGVKELQG